MSKQARLFRCRLANVALAVSRRTQATDLPPLQHLPAQPVGGASLNVVRACILCSVLRFAPPLDLAKCLYLGDSVPASRASTGTLLRVNARGYGMPRFSPSQIRTFLGVGFFAKGRSAIRAAVRPRTARSFHIARQRSYPALRSLSHVKAVVKNHSGNPEVTHWRYVMRAHEQDAPLIVCIPLLLSCRCEPKRLSLPNGYRSSHRSARTRKA